MNLEERDKKLLQIMKRKDESRTPKGWYKLKPVRNLFSNDEVEKSLQRLKYHEKVIKKGQKSYGYKEVIKEEEREVEVEKEIIEVEKGIIKFDLEKEIKELNIKVKKLEEELERGKLKLQFNFLARDYNHSVSLKDFRKEYEYKHGNIEKKLADEILLELEREKQLRLRSVNDLTNPDTIYGIDAGSRGVLLYVSR